jgi:hypothetical protein
MHSEKIAFFFQATSPHNLFNRLSEPQKTVSLAPPFAASKHSKATLPLAAPDFSRKFVKITNQKKNGNSFLYAKILLLLLLLLLHIANKNTAARVDRIQLI